MTASPQVLADRARSPGRAVRHGYPPPALPPGAHTTSYCGLPMTVQGAYSSSPPADACPLCALVWQERHDR